MNNLELFEAIETEKIPGATFEILQCKHLQGSHDLNIAEKVFFANQAGIRLKMIRIILENKAILIEPGALHFMKGYLRLESAIQGGIARGLVRKWIAGETLFQSKISGTGEVFLEPSFGHFLLFNITDDALIFDKKAFYCASDTLEVSATMQKSLSGALFGGEGWFQTQAQGSGVVVLVSPVPITELVTYELAAGEKLSVDGNFALVRTASVSFKAEKSAKTLFQSVVSGEGLLQTFTGPGTVWIAPTQAVYEKMKQPNGVEKLAEPQNNIDTHTET